MGKLEPLTWSGAAVLVFECSWLARLLANALVLALAVSGLGDHQHAALGNEKWALRAWRYPGMLVCGASECFLRPPYSPTSIGMRPTDVTSLVFES